MGHAVDEAHAELVVGGIALSQLLLAEALDDFRSAQRRLENESSPAANELYARACLLEWQVLHLEARRGEAKRAARRAMRRASEAGSAATRLRPITSIKLLETAQTQGKFVAPLISAPLRDRYVSVARSLEDTSWGAPLALNCHFQLIALGLDCQSDELLQEATREAGRVLLRGAGDSGHFANLRFWESRAAMVRGDVDAADELLYDSVTTRSKNPYGELADQFPLVNLLLVRGEADEADEILRDALGKARRVGCYQWARDAELDRLTFGGLSDKN